MIGQTSTEKGMLIGQRQILERQLSKRFGPLKPEVLARLQAMTAAQLGQLAEGLLTASSLAALGLEEAS
jgi:hypothetical protein